MASRNLIVGAFLVGGAALFGVGLFLIGDRKQVFSRHFEIYTEIDRLGGLQNGAKLKVSGMDAGDIREIRVPSKPSEKFRLELRIEEKFARVVRRDSVATIQTEGLVGNKFLDISKGTDAAPEARPGETIRGEEPLDVADVMRQADDLLKTTKASIDDVRQNVDSTLQAFSNTAGQANQMIASLRGDLKEISANGARVTSDIGELVASVKAGRGPIGKLLVDENLSARIDRSTANIEAASKNVNEMAADFQARHLANRAEATLENARQITEKLNAAVTSLTANGKDGQSTALNLREAVTSARLAMTNLADDTEALKRNFFLRGFFKRRGYYNLDQLTPVEYRKSKFVTSDDSVRTWLSGEELFALSPDGIEQLSGKGRAAVDQAMAALVAFLPNNPIMIEGYSQQGGNEERYRRAYRRASVVAAYLAERYRLDTKLIGIMPLADSPPPGTGKAVRDGVALVLLRAKK